MDIVGKTPEKYDIIYELYEPVDTTFKGNVYITSSSDSQSHFKNGTDNIIDIYQRINGAKMDLSLDEEKESTPWQ